MERGWGTPATYLECLQWFLAPTDLAGNNPDPSKAPHIINNSWGCPPIEGCATVGVLEDAVNNLRAAGILVVVSAGNSGSGCGSIDTAPAPYAASFTVGATDINDAIAGFSSRGPASVDGVSLILKPDVSGPGVGVRSSTRGGNYGNSSGTSMAGPHVAGVAALLMSADPSLRGQPERIEALMRASARPRTSAQSCGGFQGSAVPNAVFGHGIVDAERAIDLLGIGFRNGFEGPG
jgi:subtilisin family serine protease